MKIPILTLDTPNKNNRIYPRAVMEKVIAKYKKDFVDEKRAFIVKKQPENTVVNLQDVIGLINEVTFENDKVVVDVQFFPNVPEGLIMETAVSDGKLHVRTSGLGTMHRQENGTYIVGEDYELINVFITNDPA